MIWRWTTLGRLARLRRVIERPLEVSPPPHQSFPNVGFRLRMFRPCGKKGCPVSGERTRKVLMTQIYSRARWFGALALLTLPFVLACGGDTSPTAPTSNASATPNATGTWTGTMRSTSGSTRQVRITIVGAYNSSSYLLSGTWAFTNTSEGDTVGGLVQSNPFSMRLNASTSSTTWCSYNLTVTVAGNSISGDYSSSICSRRSSETGTISLTR